MPHISLLRPRVRLKTCRCPGSPSRLLRIGVTSHLQDFDDDELGGLERREADLDFDDPVVDIGLRHGVATALHPVGLLRLAAHQRALAKELQHERVDFAPDFFPEGLAVGLEHRPLKVPAQRFLDVAREQPHWHVLQLGLRYAPMKIRNCRRKPWAVPDR